MNTQMETVINRMTNFHVNWNNFRAVFAGFFFRIRGPLRRSVLENVRESIRLSLKNSKEKYGYKGNDWNEYNIFNTLSLPIRHSDKCSQNKNNPNAEGECYYEKDYYNLIQTIKYFDNSIDTVILTSEDAEVIDSIVKMIYSKDTKNYWKIILNYKDKRPDMPIVYYARSKNVNDSDVNSDPILGAMTSWLLQTNGKYMAHTRSSNYLDIIWNVNKQLNCDLYFWNDVLKLNSLIPKHINDKQSINYYINNNKRPKFLFNPWNNYLDINKGCIEMRRYGQLNKMIKKPLITFPGHIWDEIKHKGYNIDTFEQQFGLEMGIQDDQYNGIDHYCSRYTKDTWDITDEHYTPHVNGYPYP